MASHCFYKTCASRKKSFRNEWTARTGLGYFNLWHPPKTTNKTEWMNNLPEDHRDFDFDNPKHRLCTLHFEDQFVIKANTYTVNGKSYSFPLSRWRLTNDAVPTIFEGTDLQSMIKKSKNINLENTKQITDENSDSVEGMTKSQNEEEQIIGGMIENLEEEFVETVEVITDSSGIENLEEEFVETVEVITDSKEIENLPEGSSCLMQVLGFESFEGGFELTVEGNKLDKQLLEEEHGEGANLFSTDELEFAILSTGSDIEHEENNSCIDSSAGNKEAPGDLNEVEQENYTESSETEKKITLNQYQKGKEVFNKTEENLKKNIEVIDISDSDEEELLDLDGPKPTRFTFFQESNSTLQEKPNIPIKLIIKSDEEESHAPQYSAVAIIPHRNTFTSVEQDTKSKLNSTHTSNTQMKKLRMYTTASSSKNAIKITRKPQTVQRVQPTQKSTLFALPLKVQKDVAKVEVVTNVPEEYVMEPEEVGIQPDNITTDTEMVMSEVEVITTETDLEVYTLDPQVVETTSEVLAPDPEIHPTNSNMLETRFEQVWANMEMVLPEGEVIVSDTEFVNTNPDLGETNSEIDEKNHQVVATSTEVFASESESILSQPEMVGFEQDSKIVETMSGTTSQIIFSSNSSDKLNIVTSFTPNDDCEMKLTQSHTDDGQIIENVETESGEELTIPTNVVDVLSSKLQSPVKQPANVVKPTTKPPLIKIAPKPFVVHLLDPTTLTPQISQFIKSGPKSRKKIQNIPRTMPQRLIAPKPDHGVHMIQSNTTVVTPEMMSINSKPGHHRGGVHMIQSNTTTMTPDNDPYTPRILMKPKNTTTTPLSPDITSLPSSSSSIPQNNTVSQILLKTNISKNSNQINSNSIKPMIYQSQSSNSKQHGQQQQQQQISKQNYNINLLKRCCTTNPSFVDIYTPLSKIRKISNSNILLTSSIMSKLIMPSHDWCVNTYPTPAGVGGGNNDNDNNNSQLFTLSETILNKKNIEIIRKSITIEPDCKMSFTVYSTEIKNFNIGICIESLGDIQKVLNRFGSLNICSGIPIDGNNNTTKYTKNLGLLKSEMIKYNDNCFRSNTCPLLLVIVTNRQQQQGTTVTTTTTTTKNNDKNMCTKCKGVMELLKFISPDHPSSKNIHLQ